MYRLLLAMLVILWVGSSANAVLADGSPSTVALHKTLSSSGLTLFGVHSRGVETAKYASKIKEIGAKVVRLPITWHLMEDAGPGQTAQWFWRELDADIAAIEKAGAKPILQMAQTPCWASSDPNKRCQDANYDGYLKYPPTDVNNYGKAFARLAQRYKGRVLAYEIWNEPNFTGSWLPYSARPLASNDNYGSFIDLAAAAHYTNLVKATYRRLKAADPSAKVLAGSIAGGDVAYVQAMYKAGIKGYFDALAMHPYRDVYPDGKDSFGPDECPVGVRDPKFWCFQVGVESIRKAMLAAGDDKQIWFTEFGFDSNTAWNGSGRAGQAEHLQRAVNLIKNWTFVPVACWYELVDRNSSINEREYQFGLFDSALKIKPSGTRFKKLLDSGGNKPVLLSPKGNTTSNPPVFVWQSVPGASKYTLWVNEYSTPNIPGKINQTYTPSRANCGAGGECTVAPQVKFAQANAEWWVTAHLKGGSVISDAARFKCVK